MNKVKGHITSVTAAGDLVTSITLTDLVDVPRDDRVSIHCDEHLTVGIFPTNHGQAEMTFIAVEGTSGFLELLLVGESAHRFLGIGAGDEVIVKWKT